MLYLVHMKHLVDHGFSVSDYLDRKIIAAAPQAEMLSTAGRMEDLLADLAREASAEATPQNAERYAAAVMFIRTGLQSIARVRGE